MRPRVIDSPQHVEFLSPRAFLDSEPPEGVTTIWHGGVPIDLMYESAGHDKLFVSLHGALPKTVEVLPMFTGVKFSRGIEADRLFISDPSLSPDRDLTLSWYAGNRHQPDLQDVLTQVIGRYAAGRPVIFFGASGGGYASLFYSAAFPGSLAIPVNPQTAVRAYYKQHVRRYGRLAYGVPEEAEDPLEGVAATLDLRQVYEARTGNTVAYVQNTNDPLHMTKHLAPFREWMHPQNELWTLTDAWGAGHTPPPKETLSRIVTTVAASADWATGLRDAGFTPRPATVTADPLEVLSGIVDARQLHAAAPARAHTVAETKALGEAARLVTAQGILAERGAGTWTVAGTDRVLVVDESALPASVLDPGDTVERMDTTAPTPAPCADDDLHPWVDLGYDHEAGSWA